MKYLGSLLFGMGIALVALNVWPWALVVFGECLLLAEKRASRG